MRTQTNDLVAELLGFVAGEGWAGIDGVEQRMAAANQQMAAAEDEARAREAGIIAAALANDAGRALLVLLARKTLLRGPSLAEQSATTAEAYAIAKARREGENGVVLMLLMALAEPGDRDELKTDGGVE